MVLKYNPFLSIGLDYNDGNVGPQGPAGIGSANVIFVDGLDDLPTPVATVITLDPTKSYYLTGDLDLLGNRLVLPAGSSLQGVDQNTCTVTSTGLSLLTPLLTIQDSVHIKEITFSHGVAVSALGPGGNSVLDFDNVTLDGAGEYSNWSTIYFTRVGFIEDSHQFTGTIGSIVFEGAGLISTTNTSGVIVFPGTLVISRRVRFSNCIGIVTPTNKGIDVANGCVIADEQLIFDRVNFSGGGTYIGTINLSSDVRINIKDSTGIPNIAVGGKIYMNDNATATTVAATNTWYKIAGTTTNSAGFMRNFVGTNNRLTSDTTVTRRYHVQAEITFSTGNNEKCTFGIYSSSFGAVRPSSVTSTTYSNTSGTRTITTSAIEEMTDGDYVEVWVQNNTATTNITVAHLSLTVIEI